MSANPERIGRYRVEAVLGRGAMGVIYRAHDPEIDRTVAIKLIRADLLDGEDRADYLVRFRREAQAAGRCAHPNIVAIYDFAMHEGNPFLAMEFVHGVTLSQARERGTVFAVADAVFVVLQVLDALAAAHAMGVIHRDIKPANIMLVDGTRVKVTDFGISRFDSAELTLDGAIVGTPSYMSPEQCQGLAVDARSDLFSVGTVLYELLCGERPFAARNNAAVIRRLLNDEPADIGERNASVSPALAAVVARALAKAPEQRFASAGDMATALRAAVRDDTATPPLSERTIVVPRAAATSAAMPERTPTATTTTTLMDGGVRGVLERTLAQHVGPLARLLVQDAMRRAGSIEALCDLLASNVERPADRERFRAEALAQLRRAPVTIGPVASSTMLISPRDLDHAQTELTRYLGPIARVLVRREAAKAGSLPELWRLLSSKIEREADRRAFLEREHRRDG